MLRLSLDRLLVPILLIAGMVMHISLPGLGCRVAASAGKGTPGACAAAAEQGNCRRVMSVCKQRAETRRCCRAMERAVEQSSCGMTKKRCGAPPPPPPCEDEPESPQPDCMMGSCPVTRWLVILDKSGADHVAVLQLRRVDLDVLMPAEMVVRDLPPPDPLHMAARLAHNGAWLI